MALHRTVRTRSTSPHHLTSSPHCPGRPPETVNLACLHLQALPLPRHSAACSGLTVLHYAALASYIPHSSPDTRRHHPLTSCPRTIAIQP